MSLRAIKDKARLRLHRKMQVESLLYADGPAGASETVLLRVNSKDEAVGDLAGTSLAYAERAETIPKLIFLIEEHRPARGNVYVISDHEAYTVDSLEPQDGITITAVATRMKTSDVGAFTPPGA